MTKRFDEWNEIKKATDGTSLPFKGYHPRQIWWCKIGVNIGFEQDGKNIEFSRPVLILKAFSKNTCLIVPLTASTEAHKYRVNIGLVDGKPARAIISQIKVIDTKRLIEKVGLLDHLYFNQVIKNLKEIL
ncbi:MAG TPA: type II toxin-antitoxin system PemK/MazF family toxin [Candidatus Paceibacterota bacterium]|nr:type II toxin-antitoxin system PemK/MazF family toxin [Candidatus Paceibacterota bacterium]